MSYFFGVLALVAFFVGLAGAVNVQGVVAMIGFGSAILFVGGVLVAEKRRARGY